jgi:hypothetical protein
MNLENFPSSESAKRMLESVDSGGFYDKSYVGKWIFQIMGLEMDEARKFIEELPYQAFPETATWGLRYHEQKYGLPVREWMPLEERRRSIYSKRDERSPMNPYRMEVILENITGRKAHVDDESGPVNTFTVKLESGDNAVDVAAAIKKLKQIKQSHVSFTLSFTSLAKIEICGKTQRWKNQYTQCGTVPIVSTGLRIAETGVRISASAEGYKSVSPVAGNSGEAGQYPKTSTGLKIIEGAVDIEGHTEKYLANYPEASENIETGTYPNVQKQAVYSATEIQADVEGEGHKFQNKLTGTEPVISIRMKEAAADTEILPSTEATKAVYEMTGNTEAGTRPGISTGVSGSEKGVAPEVTTESYQVRYRLCGDAFEI